jgi:hypothetical protein
MYTYCDTWAIRLALLKEHQIAHTESKRNKFVNMLHGSIE